MRAFRCALVPLVTLIAACGDDAMMSTPDAGTPDASEPTPDGGCEARTPHPDPAFEALLQTLVQDPPPPGSGLPSKPPAGIGVAVYDGATLKAGAIGKRQAGGCEAFTTKTRIRLGRPARTLVSMAIRLAIAEGKLAFYDRVSDLLPGFHVTNGDGTAVTIKWLLEHSAGVFVPKFLQQCPSQDLVDYWSTVDAKLEFTPGEAVGNYDEELSLLGAVLAKVYNMPYRDVIKTKIFTPLGMTATYDHDEFLLGDHALGGAQLEDPPPCAVYEPVHQVYASLDDMVALMQFLNGTNGNALLPLTPTPVRVGAGSSHVIKEFTTGHGMEQMPYDAQGASMFFTDGDINNFGGEIDLFTDLFSVAIVDNGSPATFMIGDYVIGQLSDHDAANWLVPLPKTRWTEYATTWVDTTTQPQRELTIEFDGTKLTATYNGITEPMTSYGEDTFEISVFNVKDRIRFWRDGTGTPTLMTSQFGKIGPAFRRQVP